MTQTIKFTAISSLTVICTSALMLSGCGSSFSSNNSGSGTPITQPGPGSSGGGGTPTNTQWQSLSMDGSVGGGRFSNMQVVSIDKTTKELVLSLPMPANPYIDGAILQVPLPEVPGAKVGLESIPGGGSALVLRVPLSYLIKGVDFLPPDRLPNGDPLPAIPDGQLPSMGLQLSNIKNIKASLYFSVQTLGIFVNTPFDPLIYLQLPIKNQDGTRTWGYLTSVPAHKAPLPPADGGFFIAIQIPDDIARIIDNNL